MGAPVVLLETESYRVVLRETERWPEGYCDFEVRRRDALNEPTWHPHGGISLDVSRHNRSCTEQEDVLREVLWATCDVQGIVLKDRKPGGAK